MSRFLGSIALAALASVPFLAWYGGTATPATAAPALAPLPHWIPCGVSGSTVFLDSASGSSGFGWPSPAAAEAAAYDALLDDIRAQLDALGIACAECTPGQHCRLHPTLHGTPDFDTYPIFGSGWFSNASYSGRVRPDCQECP